MALLTRLWRGARSTDGTDTGPDGDTPCRCEPSFRTPDRTGPAGDAALIVDADGCPGDGDLATDWQPVDVDLITVGQARVRAQIEFEATAGTNAGDVYALDVALFRGWSDLLITIPASVSDPVPDDLETLLESSDVVILTPELTDETRGLIGAAELDRMREDALLVNVSRGPVVEQAALVDAIESGTIGGAGLDVFESEPVPADSSLQDLDNVVLTPHIAAMTSECRAGNIDQLAANVTRLFDGESILERYVAVEARS